jgi:carboxylesterase type B
MRVPHICCILISLASSQIVSAAPQAVDPLIVNTSSGTFRGAALPSNGLERWLGIPFAQPPTGLRRFKSPVAIVSPSGAVQNATSFGNVCPQSPSPSLGAPVGEDCLVLNVSASDFL